MTSHPLVVRPLFDVDCFVPVPDLEAYCLCYEVGISVRKWEGRGLVCLLVITNDGKEST